MLQFCSNFAFNSNLRRYIKAHCSSLEIARREAQEDAAGAHRSACDADARAEGARADAEAAVGAAHREAAHAHALAEEAAAAAAATGDELARERERGLQLGRALEAGPGIYYLPRHPSHVYSRVLV